MRFSLVEGPTEDSVIVMRDGLPLAVLEVTRDYTPPQESEYTFPQVEVVARGVSHEEPSDRPHGLGLTRRSVSLAASATLRVPFNDAQAAFEALGRGRG